MERLRLADELPVILERRYVVAKHCPALVERDLLGSLYDLWTQRYRLELAGADQAIRAIAFPETGGLACRVLMRGSWLPQPVTCDLVNRSGGTRTLYRGDTYEFRNQLGPIQFDWRTWGSALPCPTDSFTFKRGPALAGSEARACQ